MVWQWWWYNTTSPVSNAAPPANGISETFSSSQWVALPSSGFSSWQRWCLSKSARDGGTADLRVWWQTSSGGQSASFVRGQVPMTGVRKHRLSWAETGVRATRSVDQWEESSREVCPISLIQPNVWYVLCGRQRCDIRLCPVILFHEICDNIDRDRVCRSRIFIKWWESFIEFYTFIIRVSNKDIV